MTKKNDWTKGDLLNVSSSYWRGCSLQAGVRLGIFTAIDDGYLSLSDIATKIEADERGVEHLLNALSAMGLLVKEDDCYKNSSASMEFLSSKSPNYIGYIILHHHHILDGWAQLHEAVETGRPQVCDNPAQSKEVGAPYVQERHGQRSFICQRFDLLFGVLPTWHQREGIGPAFRYIPAFSLAGHQAR